LSNHDLRQTLKVCLEEVINHLKVDAAAILLLNPFSQTLEYADGRGFHSVAFQQSCLIPEESLASRAFLLKETVHIPDLNTAGSAARLAWAEKLPWIAGEGFVAYLAMPLISKSETRGILEVFHRRALQPSADWLDFFNILGRQTAIAVDNAIMLQNMQSANMELVQAYHATIEGWSRALEFRDRETQGHSQRVTELSVKLARAMGVPEEELVHVRRGALLHDIGKMGIPDSILLKPGSLNDVEQALMRQHPLYAYEMLVPIPFLRTALEIPYCHHERWDGSGYPRGLKGDKIPLSARIFALVDVWDAICSDRPYNKAWPEDKALAYVQEQSGKLFDPSVVETFLLLQTSSLRSDHVIRMSEATRNP
jgi:putative nucleotidyltransferase with HDIG domain